MRKGIAADRPKKDANIEEIDGNIVFTDSKGNTMDIYKGLKLWRQKHRMSQAKLGSIAGISKNAVYKQESGLNTPSKAVLRTLYQWEQLQQLQQDI